MKKTIFDATYKRSRRRHMHHLVLALSSTLALSVVSPAVASGIPVVDGASIADRAIKHAETIANYIEQMAILKSQLENQKRQLESITGARNLGQILDNPAIRTALPADAREILQASRSGGSGLSRLVARISQEERLTGSYETDRRNLAARTERLALHSQALLQQTQTSTTARMDQVDQLQAQINLTQDPKAIADLQARLLVEQANIQVDQTRAEMLTQQLEAEHLLILQQAEKLADSSFSIDAIRAPLPGAR